MPWIATSVKRRFRAICPSSWRSSASGGGTPWAGHPSRWFRTSSGWPACRPTSSSSRWNQTASAFVMTEATATQSTAPVVWGEPGTNAQHSFFQLIHQGTDVVPVDFLLAARPQEEIGGHHAQLCANALAQSAALAFGRNRSRNPPRNGRQPGVQQGEIERLAPHRACPGDRPSTTILYRTLDPATLGRLIALFEHKVFARSP